MHKLTTRLAKTHGTIVIEDLHVKGMLRKAGGCGGRRRRREMADAALGEFRRQITYKCGWYGSTLILADRWFPSSASYVMSVVTARNYPAPKRGPAVSVQALTTETTTRR